MLRSEGIIKGILPEESACLAFNGVMNRSVGYDFILKGKYKVEVRARHDFDNGKPYRLTVTPTKMDISDCIIPIHYDKYHEISCALLIRTSSLIPLYHEYLQKSGKQAHLNWNKVNGRDAIDVTDRLISADNKLRANGLYTH